MFFSIFKVFLNLLFGKYNHDPYLKSNKTLFLGCWLTSLGIVALSATYSYKYWLFNAGNSENATTLALIITTVIAVLVAVFMSGSASFVNARFIMTKLENDWDEVSDETKGFYQTLVDAYPTRLVRNLTHAVTIGVISLDCFANYTGARGLSEAVTNMYADNKVGAVNQDFETYKADHTNAKNSILIKYYWCRKHKKSCFGNMSQCIHDGKAALIFKAKPKLGIPHSEFAADKSKIDKMLSDSTEAHSIFLASASAANTEFEQGKNRYHNDLDHRTTFSRYLIFFLYPLGFSALLVLGSYMSRAQYYDYLRKEKAKAGKAKADRKTKKKISIWRTVDKNGQGHPQPAQAPVGFNQSISPEMSDNVLSVRAGASEATRRRIEKAIQTCIQAGKEPTTKNIADIAQYSERHVRRFTKTA